MASWTDKAPTFNPYIQQQPVDAMVKVGMYKQQQYDEGIQKIQSSIDNVAGIDIIRDVDKQYLKTKLGQLQKKLGAVAGGDFSSTQLVNSVTGMTNSIIKDKYVTAAIQSTAIDRKNLQFMAEEKKKGNSNPANTEHYYKQRQAYMDAGLQGEDGDPVIFNGSYTPYFDVNKYVRETFDGLKLSGYTLDQIYQTDESGNPIIETTIDPKTGKKRSQYVLSKTMTRLKKEGIFPEVVTSTLNNILSDPRVSQQLQISGEYQYKGFSSKYMGEMINDEKTQVISAYNKKISDLIVEKAILKNPAKQEQKQKEIDRLEDNKNKKINLYDKLKEASILNPDYVRGELYKEVMKNTWSTMYTSVKESSTVEDNPEMKINIKLQEMADENTRHRELMTFKYDQADEAKRQFNVSEQNKFNIAAMKAAADGEGNGILPPPTQAPYPAGTSSAAIINEQVDAAAGTYADAIDELVSVGEGKDVLGNLLGTTYEKFAKPFGRLSQEEIIDKMIAEVAENDATIQMGDSPNKVRAKLVGLIEKKLNENYTELPKEIQRVKASIENAKSALTEQLMQKVKLDEDAPLPNVIEKLEPITMIVGTDEDGKPIEKTLSPQMQFDLAMVFEGAAKMNTNFGKETVKGAQDRLLKLYNIDKQNAQELVLKILSQSEGYGSPLGQSSMTGIGGLMTAAYNVGKVPAETAEKKFGSMLLSISDENILGDVETREIIAGKILHLNPIARQSLLTGKTEHNTEVKKYLGGLIKQYKKSGQNESPNFTDNANNMWNVIDGVRGYNGSFWLDIRKDNVTGELTPVISVSGDNVEGEMTISIEEANNIPGVNVYNMFSDPEVKRISTLIETIGNNTTSVGNVTNINTYENNLVALHKSQFPNLQNIKEDVKANISRRFITDATGVSNYEYFNYVYVKDTLGIPHIWPGHIGYPSINIAIEKLKGIRYDFVDAVIKNDNKARTQQ